MAADRRRGASPGARGAEARAAEALAAALDERFGLALPPGDAAALARRLRHRIAERALEDLASYVEYLLHGAGEDAWEALAETLTANESRVFEPPADYLPLLELGDSLRARRAAAGVEPGAPFRALSAGCGTGEEAWSLAIALAEARLRVPALSFEVVGVDLGAHSVAAARRGVYASSRFATLPPELCERHLAARDGVLLVRDLRRSTRFARANLAAPDALRPLGGFDLVFARGVLPAMTPRARAAALANLAAGLVPGGVLLLGPGESLEGAGPALLPVRWGERHAYERPGAPGALGPSLLPEEDRVPEPGTALVAHSSPVARAWIRLRLEQRGLRVEEAADGVAALESAARGRARSLSLLERALPPEGAPWVADRLLETGAATRDRIVAISPLGGEGAAGGEGGRGAGPDGALRTAPLPLTDAALEPLLAGAAG